MRLALTIPRYDPASAGGAEVLAKELVVRLAAAGHEIVVFTTCARNHVSWANEFEPGEATVNGIRVRRFLATERRDIETLLELQERILAFEELSFDEEKRWISNGVNSEALYRHLHEAVGDALVTGIPHDVLGEVPVASVELRPSCRTTPSRSAAASRPGSPIRRSTW